MTTPALESDALAWAEQQLVKAQDRADNLLAIVSRRNSEIEHLKKALDEKEKAERDRQLMSAFAFAWGDARRSLRSPDQLRFTYVVNAWEWTNSSRSREEMVATFTRYAFEQLDAQGVK
jgi:hypothetical protein